MAAGPISREADAAAPAWRSFRRVTGLLMAVRTSLSSYSIFSSSTKKWSNAPPGIVPGMPSSP